MKLRSFLMEKISSGRRTAVLGVGSVLRSDDGAGMYFVEKLSGLIERENLLLIGGSTAPENFTGVIREFKPAVLFIVDAAHMGLTPGEIHVLDPDEITGMSFSTHMLPLPLMLNYLAMELDCEVVCIGIQPASTEQGLEMCAEVTAAATDLAELFFEALHA